MILLRFLLFRADAIRAVAADQRFLGVGLLLVISAALAREYDGEDLLHEPWYLLIPIAVSTLMGTCLACGLWIMMPRAARRAYGLGTFWRRIQTCYWMTAPLAWLYAIPYERFLSELGSVEANLWTLTVVGVWRVALMLRCILLVIDVNPWVAIFPLGFFVSVATILGIVASPHPLPMIMAGIRLPAAVARLAVSEFYTVYGAMLGAVLCGVGTLVALLARNDSRRFRPLAPPEPRIDLTATDCVTLAAIGLFLACLPFTQPSQILRRSVERAVEQQRYGEALRILSAHRLSDFPPYWTPPPPAWNSSRFGEELSLLRQAQTTDVAPWVRDDYEGRFRALLERSSWHEFWEWWHNPEALADVLADLPDGRSIAVELEHFHREFAGEEERAALDILARRLHLHPESQPGAD